MNNIFSSHLKIFLSSVIALLLVSCSSVKETTSTETKTEIKKVEVPVIREDNIPGVLYQEQPIEDFFTGEVITGKVQDSSGNIIAEIMYRPKKNAGAKARDTVGNFTAIIKPPPVPVTTSVTTNKTERVRQPGIIETFVSGIWRVLLTFVTSILILLLLILLIKRSLRKR